MIGIISNNIDNATITSSGENPYYLFSEGLIDTRLSRVGRTVGINNQWIKLAYAEAVDVDIVGIFGNNFTKDATVKIQANATDSWGAPTVEETMVYTKNGFKSNELGIDVGEWTYQFSSTQSYKYWRIFVDDPTNLDGYIKIGFVFMDEKTVFPGMAVNQVFKRNTTSETAFSVSGQAYGLKRLQYNEAAFTFPVVTETEKSTIDTFFDTVDTTTPFMLLVWEDSLDVQRPLYVVNTTLPEWKRSETIAGITWTFNHSIQEVF